MQSPQSTISHVSSAQHVEADFGSNARNYLRQALYVVGLPDGSEPGLNARVVVLSQGAFQSAFRLSLTSDDAFVRTWSQFGPKKDPKTGEVKDLGQFDHFEVDVFGYVDEDVHLNFAEYLTPPEPKGPGRTVASFRVSVPVLPQVQDRRPQEAEHPNSLLARKVHETPGAFDALHALCPSKERVSSPESYLPSLLFEDTKYVLGEITTVEGDLRYKLIQLEVRTFFFFFIFFSAFVFVLFCSAPFATLWGKRYDFFFDFATCLPVFSHCVEPRSKNPRRYRPRSNWRV